MQRNMENATQAAGTGISPDGRVHLNATLLKVLRQGRALSQEALADLCFSMHLCVSIASIKRAEAGKSVLYRTARHLAQVFEIKPEQLQVAPEEAPVPAKLPPATGPAEQRLRYVIELHAELHASGSEQAQHGLAQLVGKFGGQLASQGQRHLSVIFGLARACLGDAGRAMRCALELARECSLDICGGMALRLVRWDSVKGRSCSVWPGAPVTGARDIWVERTLALQLRDAFVFSRPNEESGYQRYIATGSGVGHTDRPMIGRDAELRQFKGIVETLHQHQCGHVVYVRGMAGVGKTRLVQAFRELGYRAGLESHHCAVQDDAGTLPQLARSLFGSIAEEGDMLAGLRDLIIQSAVACPLLIIIEDIHRGDDRLFASLGTLINQTRDVPVIWVLSARSENDPAGTAFRPHLSELPLSVFEMAALSEREARILALQFPKTGAAHRQRCVDRSRGNPLFLTQLLADTGGQPLPDSLKHLIQIRMDELTISDRHALRMAAVIGPSVTLTTLRAALRLPDYVPENAVRHGLLRQCGTDGTLFAHELVIECIVDAIDPAERRRLHGSLVHLYRDGDPILYAHHLRCADEAPAFSGMRVQVAPPQFETREWR
jgi:hypothetical protein